MKANELNSKELPKFPYLVTRNGISAKIYRRLNKGYVVYEIAYYDGTKRKMESFSDFETAEKRALDIIKGIGKGDHAVLTLRPAERAIYQRALKVLESINIPLDVAVERYASAVTQLGTTPLMDAVDFYLKRYPKNMTTKTVLEVVNAMIDAKKKDGMSTVYIRDMDMRLHEFADAFHCPISSIDTPILNEWLRNLDCGGRTRNNFRGLISTMFKFAEAQEWLPKDHVDFEKVAKAKEDQADVEIFTPEEMITLLDAARINPDDLEPGFNKRYANRQGLLPLLVLGGFAGMRTAEITRQLWSDINLERGFIRVTAVKGNTAQKRLIPISSNLKAWLSVCKREALTCCDYPRTNEAIQRLSDKAGIPWKHNGLRHSYCSYRMAEIQNPAQVAMEAGNSVAMIHRHYKELVTPEEGKTWFSIMPPRPASNIIPMPNAVAV